MPLRALSSPNSNHDLLHRAFFLEQLCLILAIQISVINLLATLFPSLENWLPAGLIHMRLTSACAALCASVALFLLESDRKKPLHRAGLFAAAGTILLATFAFLTSILKPPVFSSGSPASPQTPWFLSSFVAFFLLGLAILLVKARHPFPGHLADAITAVLIFLVLLLLSETVYGLAKIPGSYLVGPVKIPTIACLMLLTITLVLRRAENGLFSCLLSGGIDGRFARILAPILIVLPMIREMGRARLLDAHLVPSRYATAILSSSATIVSFLLLFALSRLINRMQLEVQQLNLRDELTGLYNFRGFNLLAEQAYRLAARSRQPFGVLFVDMDNLKVINDAMGHSIGSIFLIETAKMLTSTFRETDVIGRLGGDEFVVAGQFDPNDIARAIDRLRGAAASRNVIDGHTLSLSLGFATADYESGEPLKAIISRADKVMYKEKREKKRAVAR